MRGSLIQEIFRVVNETHSSTTKKNKEWQQKLPIVVLKAEEIMYSKANSEAEYMDLETLWERANDAIYAIIRRDESTETGDLLQPCIEAALNLGCTPRKTSRSQSNSNPRWYLNPGTLKPSCVSPTSLDDKIQANSIANSPLFSQHSNFMKPTTVNLTLLGSESPISIPPKNNPTTKKLPFLSGNISPHMDTQTCASSVSCSVYPLYYENQHQSPASKFDFHVDNGEVGSIQNLFPCDVDALNTTPQAVSRETPESPLGIGFGYDLSLRLGPLSVPCIGIENSWPKEGKEVFSSICPEPRKLSTLSPCVNEEFSFFPKPNVKWSSETENLNGEAMKKKRKSTSNVSEDRQFCSRPKVIPNHLTRKFEQCRFVD